MKKKTVIQTVPVSYEKIKAGTLKTRQELEDAGWKATKETLGVCQVWKLNGTDLFWDHISKIVAGTRERGK